MKFQKTNKILIKKLGSIKDKKYGVMNLGYYAMNFSRSRIVSLLDNFSLASIVEKFARKLVQLQNIIKKFVI